MEPIRMEGAALKSDEGPVRVSTFCNAPSEKEERKGQGNPRYLNGPHPDTMRSGTAGAVDFAG
jgi:hypothetical protein